MNKKRAVVDASSAILLAKTGLFRRLTDTYQVVMAQAVFAEISRAGYPGACRFSADGDGGRIRILSPRPGAASGAEAALSGSGERETIRLFSQGEGEFVVIDDRKGAGYCRHAGIPYINALLFPRILMLAGAMSEGDCRRRTERLLSLGRYSEKIAAIAAEASREHLGRFLPS